MITLMKSRIFGQLPTGETVEAFTLTNAGGAAVEILTWGGIVRSLEVPDREGTLGDVVLGFDDLRSYIEGSGYFGAIVGRIAGRVTNGRIVVEEEIFQLPLNNGTNHLHGGGVGWDRRLWQAESVEREDGAEALRLRLQSADGEEGYPGNVDCAVTFTWTDDNALLIASEVTTDRTTPICLAHHSYFNLAGDGTIADHVFRLEADEFVPQDEVGTLQNVRTPVSVERGNDFRQPTRLGPVLERFSKVHDLYFLAAAGSGLVPVAHLSDPVSGRVLTVSTMEDCLQTYSAADFDGSVRGKAGRFYIKSAGLCLECQGYPNATTETGFGDILVQPGQPRRHLTEYAFSTR